MVSFKAHDPCFWRLALETTGVNKNIPLEPQIPVIMQSRTLFVRSWCSAQSTLLPSHLLVSPLPLLWDQIKKYRSVGNALILCQTIGPALGWKHVVYEESAFGMGGGVSSMQGKKISSGGRSERFPVGPCAEFDKDLRKRTIQNITQVREGHPWIEGTLPR